MRNMIATTLTHLAGPRPTGLRVLFASMARIANAALDRLARASYVEGLLGYRPGSIARNMGMMDEALEAVRTRTGGNKIADALLFDHRMSEKDAMRLLGTRDTQLKQALTRGVRMAVPRNIEALRGLTVDFMADEIADGISPITGKPFPAFKGGNIYWHTGSTAKGKTGITMGSIAKILEKRGFQKAQDILEGTRQEELGAMYLDAPIGDGEAGAVLHDAVGGDSAITRADYVTMYEAVFKSPAIMRAVDKAVKAALKGPAQERVWEVVKVNPDLIIIDEKGKIGVSSSGLAKAHAGMFGEEETAKPSVLRRVWVDKVWPAMTRAFKDSEVARALLRKQEIREIIEEETRRRRQNTTKVKNIGIKFAAKRVAARYMQKQARHQG